VWPPDRRRVPAWPAGIVAACRGDRAGGAAGPRLAGTLTP